MAADIIAGVGGKQNVVKVIHCITRLRFYLKNHELADDQGISQLNGVAGVNYAESLGQYQVVIGPAVTDVYDEVISQLGDGVADDSAKSNNNTDSASKNAPTILKQLGLTDYFIGIVDPSTLAHGKPNPEIYIKAGELLKLAPQQIIGLEDASAGVKAIQGAGQTAFGIGTAVSQDNLQLWFADTASVTLDNIKQQLTQ